MQKMPILVQESSQSIWHDIDKIPKEIRKHLIKSKCIKCSGELKGKVDYIILKNRILWWHTKGNHHNYCIENDTRTIKIKRLRRLSPSRSVAK